MNARDRRALMIGGAVVVTALMVLRAGPFLAWEVRAAEAALAIDAERLELLEAGMRALPGLEDSARVVRDSIVALAPRLLEGGTPAAAAAALSVRLTAVADRHGAKLARMAALPDSGRVGSLGRVRVRAELESDMRGIAGVLAGIAGDPAALRVLELQVTAPDASSGDAAPEVLRADVTVTGWFSAGEPR